MSQERSWDTSSAVRGCPCNVVTVSYSTIDGLGRGWWSSEFRCFTYCGDPFFSWLLSVVSFWKIDFFKAAMFDFNSRSPTSAILALVLSGALAVEQTPVLPTRGSFDVFKYVDPLIGTIAGGKSRLQRFLNCANCFLRSCISRCNTTLRSVS